MELNDINLADKIYVSRERVASIMRKDGASDEFINRELTDSAIKEALKNNFSAESLAWTLLQ